jgi:hypothetical protein
MKKLICKYNYYIIKIKSTKGNATSLKSSSSSSPHIRIPHVEISRKPHDLNYFRFPDFVKFKKEDANF